MSALGFAAAAAPASPAAVNLADWATPIVVALVGGLVTVVVARANRKAQAEQNFIDQLQEEQRATRERIEKLESMIVALEARQMISLNYIYVLRTHISEGKPPPPPDWPEGMMQR